MEKNITPDSFLSKDDTKVMKAVAICLMLMHHLWCFPNRLAGAPLINLSTAFGISSPVFFGFFGKICVPMFFFLGGYGVYKSYFGRKFDLVGKLKSLYFAYWKVFLIFIPVGFIFFSDQGSYCNDAFISSRFATYSTRELLANFFGFTSSYNREWWFLSSYAISLVCFPFIRGIIDRFSTRVNLFLMLIVCLLVVNVFPGVAQNQTLGVLGNNRLYLKFFCQIAPYATCFWMGAVVARNGLMDRLNEGLKAHRLLNPLFDIVVWIGVIFLRQLELGEVFDIFFVPVLCVVTMDLVNRIKLVRKGCIGLGKQSTNMWLTHTFFCYYIGVLSKVVTAPKYAVLSLLVLILLTFLCSHAINFFWKGIGLGYGKVKELNSRKVQ